MGCSRPPTTWSGSQSIAGRSCPGLSPSPLREILGDIATRNRWRVLALEIQPDHLHLFLSVPPTIAVAAAIRQLKGASSRYLRAMCPQLRRICRSGHLWAPSYYVGSAGNVSAQTLRRYIERAVHVSSRR